MRTSYLPATVAAVADAPIRLNSSKLAMRELATELYDVPDDKLPCVMATILGQGIMFTHLWLRIAARIGARRNKTNLSQGWHDLFMALRQKQGNDDLMALLTEMRHTTVEHILRGKDREDANSVGGLSKREAQAVANIIAVSRRYEHCDIPAYNRAACNRVHGGL